MGYFRGTDSALLGYRVLTDLGCRRAKPEEKPYKLFDERGLYLFVTPAGSRIWRMKYTFAKKEKLLVFGPFPEISLKEARDQRDAARKLLREGIDPGVAKKQRAAAAAVDANSTFKAVAEDWWEAQTGRWSPKHAKDVKDSLEDDVYPAIGSMPIRSVTAPLVRELVKAVEDRGAVETAHRIRQRISAVFARAISDGLADADPAAPVRSVQKPRPTGRRFPALRTVDQARTLLRKTEEEPAQPTTKLASRLLALTLVRPGILRAIPWWEFEELEGKHPIWRVPAERLKLELQNKQQEAFELIVPLSRQAVDVINAVRRITGRCAYVFPNHRHPHRPLSENAIGYMYNRHGYRGRHVPHGWRSTFSTVMNERAVDRMAEEPFRKEDRLIVDMMLAHVQDDVEPLYNRAAYAGRRREIAQEWADLILDGFPPAEELLKGPRR